MIEVSNFQRHLVDVSGQPKQIVGLPEGVLNYRVKLRRHQIPVIFLRFSDRVQKHVLVCSGDALEPLENADAMNLSKEVAA